MASISKRKKNNIYFSIESIQKFLILNRYIKCDSGKMITTTFTEKNLEHQHHIISCHQTGYRVCDECGETFGRIYDTGAEFYTNGEYFYSILNKFEDDTGVLENLYLISHVKSNLEISGDIFKNSLYLFNEALEKINIKTELRRFFALSCVYYSVKESNCSILLRDILEIDNGDVGKDILKKFNDAYYDLTKKLGLKKLVLKIDFYIYLLSKEFGLDRNEENMVKLIISQIKRFFPLRKQMNSGIAAAVFYINSKIFNLDISQKQIAETLRISRSAVCEYTKDISLILSGLYCEERNYKLGNEDLHQLKMNLNRKITTKLKERM